MKTTVTTSTGEYPVITGHGILKDFADLTQICREGTKAAVVTDDNVAPLWLDRLLSVLPDGTLRYVIPHGEKSKNWTLAGELLEKLAADGFCRDDTLVALGGGVVGDITGFVASVYMRGVPYVQVPTTLLAAIDSSVGGKTAVDLKAGKNLAGRIYPPKAVVCDLDTLATLPRSEWKCGLGEAVKYAVLAGGEIFDIMESGAGAENLERLIDLCVDYKRRIVEADENEGGLRRLLNLGHTVGHAIEAESALGFPHGVCVAMGIKVIARASVSAGYLPKDEYLRISALLQKYGFPECPYPLRSVIMHAAHDKKISGGKINAVVIRGIGRCETVPMTLDELKEFVS
ncbi:MAG TPA: 3-dehydroquinate synthase [Candidatus Limadaptatus stercoravium]|nr:3-dehydroquinate synthase [Candidatus Limadaptatus stercoravium]